MSEIDQSKFDYKYVPGRLKETANNWRSLSGAERMGLTWELSLASWEKLGVVYDPRRSMEKTIRRIERMRG
jgi:hypothetical protein